MAEGRDDAEKAFDRFPAKYQAKYDKAADCLAKDRETLLALYDFPAEHWKHIRTGNPIESTFATVRHRTVRSKGCLSSRPPRSWCSKPSRPPRNHGASLMGRTSCQRSSKGSNSPTASKPSTITPQPDQMPSPTFPLCSRRFREAHSRSINRL